MNASAACGHHATPPIPREIDRSSRWTSHDVRTWRVLQSTQPCQTHAATTGWQNSLLRTGYACRGGRCCCSLRTCPHRRQTLGAGTHRTPNAMTVQRRPAASGQEVESRSSHRVEENWARGKRKTCWYPHRHREGVSGRQIAVSCALARARDQWRPG